jgi:hypothetical protein
LCFWVIFGILFFTTTVYHFYPFLNVYLMLWIVFYLAGFWISCYFALVLKRYFSSID